MSTTTLVTGASGFLGSHVIDGLLARGEDVRALVRNSSDTSWLDAKGVPRAVGDVCTGDGLADALCGVDAVIHCAGGGKVRRATDFDAQNADSTAHLLAAAERAGVPRFVLASSLSAAGPSLDGTPRTDDETRPVSRYGAAKAKAEALVLDAMERLHVTVVRPPAIYGPRDTRWLPLFASVKKRGLAPLPPGRTLSIVYGPDCADALVRARFGTQPSGRVYFVDDGATHTWRSISEEVGVALGKRPRFVPVPSAALFLSAALSEGFACVKGEATALTRDKWRDGKQAHWVCASDRTRAELGWAPTVSLDEGVQKTARFYEEAGWV